MPRPGAPRLRQQLREGLFRKKVPDFPRDRRLDALDGVSIEKHLRCQDAQAEASGSTAIR